MANRVSIPAAVVAIASLRLSFCGGSSPLKAGESAAPPTAVSGDVHRDMLFSEGWKFHLGDVDKAKDPAFDDSAWRTLDLPHDWSIEGAFDPKLASCTAFLPCGIGWYRKTFTVAADAKDKLVSVRFDGVMNHSQVWCNGRLVGGRPYGYSSFTCNLTPAIRFGEKNVIEVRVDHTQYADSRWYAGSGIYRNVYLNVTGKVHIDTNGVSVTTPKVTGDSAEVEVRTIVTNDSPVAANIVLMIAIEDDRGHYQQRVGEQAGTVLAAGQKQFTAAFTIARPNLWSPDLPRMYHVISGATMNTERGTEWRDLRFGIRTFAFDPAKGFSLNGQPMKLKGVCLHHDAGALGAAVPIQIWQRRLKLLKEPGCNAIRCSHNPPAPEFFDLCDRMGFLVMDEAFDEWTRGKKKWIVGHNIGRDRHRRLPQRLWTMGRPRHPRHGPPRP